MCDISAEQHVFAIETCSSQRLNRRSDPGTDPVALCVQLVKILRDRGEIGLAYTWRGGVHRDRRSDLHAKAI